MKFFISIFFIFPIFAQTEKIPECGNQKIEFKDYMVKETFKEIPKELNLQSVKEKKLHFFLGLKPRKYKSPNFAGHFRMVRGGCGTMCKTYVAIDLKNGEPYHLGVSASLGFRFRKDSSLVIIDPDDEIKKWNASGDVYKIEQTTYYNWLDGELKPICVKKIQNK